MRKFLVGFAIALALCSYSAIAGAGPTTLRISQTEATYLIPPAFPGTYKLNLWHAGKLVGIDSGSTPASFLTVAVPYVPGCTFQADVQRNGKYITGERKTLSSCGPIVTTTTATTSAVPVTLNASTIPVQHSVIVPVKGPGPKFIQAAPSAVAFTG